MATPGGKPGANEAPFHVPAHALDLAINFRALPDKLPFVEIAGNDDIL